MVPRAAAVAAAVLLCTCVLTAWAVPLFDPDEGYYPATAAESVDAGRSWDLRFNGEPRWDKPVLAYALIQSAFLLFGRSDGAARIPSAVQGAALVLAVAAIAGAFAGADAAAFSAIVLSTTVGIQVFSRVAHPEIALALSIGVTQLLLVAWLVGPAKAGPYVRHGEERREEIRGGRLQAARKEVRGVRLQADQEGKRGPEVRLQAARWLPLLIGVSMAYGLLAKGPVAVVIPAVGVLLCAPFVLDRERWGSAIRDGLIAGAVSIVLAAPWYTAMTLRYGSAFLRDALWQQNVARYTGQLAVHVSVSPLYYVLPAIAALLPWTALLLPALGRIRRPRDGDTRTQFRFCVAMMGLGTFGFYSLSASKLASYILALVPSVSVLIGMYLAEERGTGGRAWPYRATSIVLLLTAAVLVVLATGRVIPTRELTGGVPGVDADTMLLTAALPPALVLAGGGALVLMLRARARTLALAAVGALAPLVIVIAARPLAQEAYPWQRFAAVIARDPAPVWLNNFRAPSLTFYRGHVINRLTDDTELPGIVRGAEGWLIVPQERIMEDPLAARIEAHRAAIVSTIGNAVLVRLEPRSEASGAAEGR